MRELLLNIRRPSDEIRRVVRRASSVVEVGRDTHESDGIESNPSACSARSVGSARSAWPFIAKVVVLSRIVAAIGLYRGHTSHAYLVSEGNSYVGVHNWWLNPWTYFDSQQFLDLARLGYDEVRIAFFPLYPALLRLGGHSDVAMAGVGIAVSVVSFVGGLRFVYLWVRQENNEATARRTVWLMAFFPMTVVWTSMYSEGLFLLLFAAFLWALRSKRFALAVVLGLLTGATRNTGLVISGALVAEMIITELRARRLHERAPFRWTYLVASLAPLLSFVVFEAWVVNRYGLQAPRHAQELFSRQLHWPIWPIAKDLQSLAHPGFVTVLNLAAVGAGVAFAWRAIRNGRFFGGLLILGVLTMHLTFPTLNVPHANGAARYLLPLIPFHFEVADFIDRRASRLSSTMRSVAMSTWSLLALYVALNIGHKYFAVG